MELSIIIVSYNTSAVLHDCLDSIYKETKDLNFEVIVVDNASSDGSPDMVERDFPQVKLIRQNINPGFGVANNTGAQKAIGDWLLFLNPDTILFNNALKESLDAARELPKVGAFGCRLLFSDKTIQPTGGYFPTLFRLFAWHTALDEIPYLNKLIKPIHPSAGFYHRSFQPDWIIGAFMLIPKKVFSELDGFDKDIFMYAEELELCYRIKQKGYRIYYTDHPSIIHLQAKSSSSHFAMVKEVEGIKYFFTKHKPRWQRPYVNIIFKIGSLLRLVLFGIIMGDATRKATYLEILQS